MASLAGKLDMEMEVKSNADKFWQSIRNSPTLFPKALPHLFKTIQVLEGDGKSLGSVRLVHFGEAGSPIVRFAKVKIEKIEEEKKTISYRMVEGDLMKYYKSLKATLMVTPKGDGSLMKWECEFEKTSDKIWDPNCIRDFTVNTFKDLDAYLNP